MANEKGLSLENALPAIRNWINNKFVAKITGKGLSTEDYTTDEKDKLNGIEPGAQKNPASLPANGGNSTTVNNHTVNADVPAGAKFTDTTYNDMTGATSSAAGTHGLVPAPAAGNQAKFLRGDGTWQTPPNTTYSKATAAADGLMSKEDYNKLNAFQQADQYALKSDVVGAYHYKGSVANQADLPASGNAVGDVYNIEAKSDYGPAGTNVAWTADEAWDSLGGNFTIDFATAAEVLAILNA
ncbi:hypothetical protein [Lacrimispora indolis]|uniref:hypothetical protein n=1 Tax=Lacrimispora indolis TaxID=69825 RepID=UPI0003FD7E19|nr:hypothetical protein [[Clostridium] methoxybenzovorans]